MSLLRLGLTPLRRTVQASVQRAAFHTSVKPQVTIPFLKQIPQPPGYIVGDVNDAYVVPPSSKTHGSVHWTVERVLSVALVPLAVVPFVTGSFAPALDATFSTLILAHSFVGFQACIIDYIPARVYGKAHDYAMWLLTFGTAVAGYGIYQLEANDIGLTALFAKLWTAPSSKKEEAK